MLSAWFPASYRAVHCPVRSVVPIQLCAPVANLKSIITTSGPSELAEPLAAALRAQWAYGFPIVPKPGLQLTHGFLHYPAGMQALAAAHMLEVLPGGLLLDPFVGGGTTLVEAIHSGRDVVGADVSPLALFAAGHHTWQATDEQIDSLRSLATRALTGVDPSFTSGGWRRGYDAAPSVDTGDSTDTADGEEDEGATPRPLAGPPSQAAVRGLERGGKGKTTFAMWQPLQAQVESLEEEEGPSAPWRGGGPPMGATATATDTDTDTDTDTETDTATDNDDDDASSAGCSPSASSPPLSPLWFCFAAAQQRAERFRYSSVLESFDATVDSYCEALRALRGATPADSLAAPLVGGSARLFQSDARMLSLASLGLPLCDAVLTSPPYAGVYDYLSHARESRARLGAKGDAPLMGLQGTPSGRDWPADWRSSHEMGARKAMKKLSRGGASVLLEAWDADQRSWLSAMRDNLRVGGRAALLVGDGEAEIDALASTRSAAEAVGLDLIASATIASTAQKSDRKKGRRRPEHVLLLEKRA